MRRLLVVAALVGMAVVGAPGDGVEAAFPGQNGLIAFAKDYDIWVMNPDGSGQENLTGDGSATMDASPAWSADGAMIAFSRDGDIYVMAADGTEISNITESAADDVLPSWSPDGRIAFTSSAPFGAPGDIWVIDADGTDATNLTSSSSGEAGPVWSPDGSKIAFVAPSPDTINCRAELFVMNSDGTGAEQLTCELQFIGHPSWSPDGTRIAFWVGFGTDVDIGVIDAGGGEVDRIIDTNSPNLDPAWSPDGTKIVYFGSSGAGAEFGTYIYDVAGGGSAKILEEELHAFDWQPVRPRVDVDCDGEVDSADARRILLYAGGLAVPSLSNCPDMGSALAGGGIMGDLNCDGTVDASDVLAAFRQITGLPPVPPGCAA